MKRILECPRDAEEAARQTVDAAFRVHSQLGAGLLESVYGLCLVEELMQRGVACEREVSIPVVYNGKRLETGFRADLLVGQHLLVELKSVERLLPVHRAQVITYLKLTARPLGLLINFNVPLIKDGIVRLFHPSRR